jgi:hypothetical protein
MTPIHCEVCNTEYAWLSGQPCLDCVKARHRAAISHKCSCPKRLKQPITHKVYSRVWIACKRCFGTIKQLA